MKLNKSTKDELIKKVVKATFAEKLHALHEEKVRLGEHIYRALYKDPDVLIINVPTPMTCLEAAPEGFFPKRSEITIQISGQRWTDTTMPLAYPRSIAYKHYYGAVKPDEFSDSDFRYISETCHGLIVKKQQIEKQQDALKCKLKAFIEGFTTYHKLFTEWPEAANYISIPETTKNLPTVLVDEVRSTIERMKA